LKISIFFLLLYTVLERFLDFWILEWRGRGGGRSEEEGAILNEIFVNLIYVIFGFLDFGVERGRGGGRSEEEGAILNEIFVDFIYV
jgi:hypothetical protein